MITATLTTEIRVVGMSCAHCQHAVTGALTQLPGVVAVVVDLARGTATVESQQVLDPVRIGAGYDAAGYDTEWAA